MSVVNAGNAAPESAPAGEAPRPGEPTVLVELAALFEAHGGYCYSLARRVLRDADLAQDVVQEAFLEHWRTAAFDATQSTHRRWLLMLTHRKAVDRVRHEQHRRTASLDVAPEQASPQRATEDLALANVVRPGVRAALLLLPRGQQEALALAYWGGYTQREVAEITGVPLGTAKTRMRDGMVALRELLRGEWQG